MSNGNEIDRHYMRDRQIFNFSYIHVYRHETFMSVHHFITHGLLARTYIMVELFDLNPYAEGCIKE